MFRQRVFHFGLRLVVAMLGTMVVAVMFVRAYVAYEIHRATSMLAEASRVQVGEAETAVLPLIERYGGFKWAPDDSLGRKEDWIEKEEYDYQKEVASDYRYDIGVSPFDLIPSDLQWRQHRTPVIRAAIRHIPSQLRAVLGLRDWGAEVGLTIRGSRVQSVSGMVLLEGRTRWLEHEWTFANAMPERRMLAKAFVVEMGFLEMGDKGGDVVHNIFTPRHQTNKQRYPASSMRHVSPASRAATGIAS
jgi:hypothetical protein